MYISKDPTAYHELYFRLVRDITQAAPSMWSLIESINNQILTGELYKALKEVKKLINYEKELLENATRQQSIRTHCQGDGKPA
jgi:flagellar protein FlbT